MGSQHTHSAMCGLEGHGLTEVEGVGMKEEWMDMDMDMDMQMEMEMEMEMRRIQRTFENPTLSLMISFPLILEETETTNYSC